MKTKADGVPRAFDRYTKQEVELILSLTPTHGNVKTLAKALGRTQDAIYLIYYRAYSDKWLKEELESLGPDHNNVVTKIAAAKKKLGIVIGHEPD